MKDSKVRARQAQAAESAAKDVADLHRKVDLVLAHLGINAAVDPEADALVDARAAESAGEATERQKALLAEQPGGAAEASGEAGESDDDPEPSKRARRPRR